ncbi:MAG: Asp-tRNA(Asn)/Glu-tRNA(Gln) amidotransferase subunit GatC [bacterium]|nr:Asp-tRNA(Asn)/Glu-tRNA(Gln) amidotransferase subunit GatC [bacterium]
MLTTDDVRKIAELARIRLDDAELEKLQNEFGTILDFVGKLREVQTEGVEPTKQVTGIVNALRKDTLSEERPEQSSAEDLLGQAPQREEGHIKVKAVFE